MSSAADRRQHILDDITKAASLAKRDPAEVTLIAVTKGRPAEEIEPLIDAGATYSLSRRIALTGGVRYNIERERLSALQDQRRDSQAVYVGTAFKF